MRLNHLTKVNMEKITLLFIAVAFACVAPPGLSQSIKKYVTPDNKIIYSDKPVPGAREAGEVAPPQPVSPEARESAKKAARREAQEARGLEQRAAERQSKQARIEELEARLERAKKQLADGKEPLPAERSGSAGGGSRLNEQYWARQKANESAVAAAQKELDDARAGN